MGKLTRVGLEEKQEIWDLHFGQGKSMRDIAQITGRNLSTVFQHLNTPEAKKFAQDLQAEMNQRAKNILVRGAERAAQSWMKQLELADRGDRANHNPAKDLLQAMKAIDIPVPNADRGTKILIQIGSGTPEDIQAEVIEGELVE